MPEEENITISTEEYFSMKNRLRELEDFNRKVTELYDKLIDPRLPDLFYFFHVEPEYPDGVTREMMLEYYGRDLVELLRLRYNEKIGEETFDRLMTAAITQLVNEKKI